LHLPEEIADFTHTALIGRATHILTCPLSHPNGKIECVMVVLEEFLELVDIGSIVIYSSRS
jgi:hypothetical protein